MSMRESLSMVRKTGAVLLAVSLCTALHTGCSNDMAQRAAKLSAAGKPAIYDSKAPFTLGELIGEPSEKEPWWTLKYGGFPVMSSSEIPAGLAENFAEAHIGYPNRDKSSAQFVKSDGRDYIMEQFLERNEYGGGDYYDYERGIRFEKAVTNLLLLTEVSQNDRDYLESKGDKVVADELARTALIFIVPANFPADNLTLEQLKGVLSGRETDWTSLGVNLPVSLHYWLNDDFRHMLDACILHGEALAGSATELQKTGTLTGTVTIPVNVEYDNQPGSVGIFAYGEAPDIEDAKILTIEGAAPSEETIRSGEYPVIVGCYAVYWEIDRNNAPGRFVEWCASEEGTDVIRASGLIPVK